MKKIITIEILGGLGNQLFQYWLGQRIQFDTGRQIEYRTSSISKHETFRHLELVHFKLGRNLDTGTRNVSELKWFLLRLTYSILRRFKSLRKIFSKFKKIYLATEVGFDESPKFYARYNQVIGQFQSYLYLEPIREKILKNMDLVRPSKKFEELAMLLESLQPIVVHVRGGDYNRLKESFGLLDFKYFLNAITVAHELTGNRPLWLFSDDHSRASYITKNLRFKFDQVICKNEDLTSSETLEPISKGHVVIISNSTFSWWGAWLSEAHLVLAPDKWFKGMPDPKFLYPNNWKTMTSTWI